MELKKCINCGEFISSNSNICSSCQNKLNYGKTVLKNYFEESEYYNCSSIKQISSVTGLSPSMVQSYMVENNYIEAPTAETDEYYTNVPY